MNYIWIKFMKSYSWNGQEFTEVDDPTYNENNNDISEGIRKAGYRPEISSKLEDGFGADIAIYVTDEPGNPRFYIDLMGQNTGIATLVANDFPHLVKTLKEIQPLISIMGLDQFAAAQTATE